MNNITKEHHENSIPLNAFLYVDKLPETQSLEIQNTNKESPIQLKIDSATDYGAIGATIFASIIAAWVTVKLVSNSNSKLIDSQNNHQNKLLGQQNEQHLSSLQAQKEYQQREVLAKNRQEWINEVRKLIAKIVSDSQTFIIALNKEQITRRDDYLKNIDKELQDSNKSNYFEKSILLIQNIDFQITYLDLLLSKNDDLDRTIFCDLTNMNTILNHLLNIYISSDSSTTVDTIHNQYYKHFKDCRSLNNNIIENTKDLLKNEWQKVKQLE